MLDPGLCELLSVDSDIRCADEGDCKERGDARCEVMEGEWLRLATINIFSWKDGLRLSLTGSVLPTKVHPGSRDFFSMSTTIGSDLLSQSLFNRSLHCVFPNNWCQDMSGLLNNCASYLKRQFYKRFGTVRCRLRTCSSP